MKKMILLVLAVIGIIYLSYQVQPKDLTENPYSIPKDTIRIWYDDLCWFPESRVLLIRDLEGVQEFERKGETVIEVTFDMFLDGQVEEEVTEYFVKIPETNGFYISRRNLGYPGSSDSLSVSVLMEDGSYKTQVMP